MEVEDIPKQMEEMIGEKPTPQISKVVLVWEAKRRFCNNVGGD